METDPYLNLKVVATLQLMVASEFQDKWAAKQYYGQLAQSFAFDKLNNSSFKNT